MDKTPLSLKEYSEDVLAEIQKHLETYKAKEIKGDGTFKVIASTADVDRDGEKILIEAWDFKNYMNNPIMLWGHNYYDVNAVVGAVTNIKAEDGQVVIEGTFAETEAAQVVRKLYDDGVIRTVSVGFIPKQRDGNTITEAELLEVSFVPVPANPNALALSKAIKEGEKFEKMYLKTDDAKAAVEFEETATGDAAIEWDSQAAEERIRDWSSEGEGDDAVIDYEKYRKAFAWYDSEKPDELASYKLPHHDIVDGELTAVWQGTLAAMGSLLGEGGDVQIPEGDAESVYNHLAQHYEQFGEEAPEFSSEGEGAGEGDDPDSADGDDEKTVKVSKGQLDKLKKDVMHLIDSYVVEDTKGVEKAGRTLSGKSKTLVKKAIEALTELLEHADDEKDFKKFFQQADKLIGEGLRELK